MCVAVIKPENVDIPSSDVFKKCWESNPHGAGFAYPTEKGVHILKGFMGFDAFMKSVDQHKKDMKGKPCFFHFRIATAGGVYAGMTHPFPVSNRAKSLKSTDIYAPQIFMHNGVIQVTPRAKDWSDSAEVAAMIYEAESRKMQLPDILAGMKPLLGLTNRVATMDASGKVLTEGTWEEKDGIKYSNMFWEYDGFEYGYGQGWARSRTSLFAATPSRYERWDPDYWGFTAKDVELFRSCRCPMCNDKIHQLPTDKHIWVCDSCAISMDERELLGRTKVPRCPYCWSEMEDDEDSISLPLVDGSAEVTYEAFVCPDCGTRTFIDAHYEDVETPEDLGTMDKALAKIKEELIEQDSLFRSDYEDEICPSCGTDDTVLVASGNGGDTHYWCRNCDYDWFIPEKK